MSKSPVILVASVPYNTIQIIPNCGTLHLVSLDPGGQSNPLFCALSALGCEFAPISDNCETATFLDSSKSLSLKAGIKSWR